MSGSDDDILKAGDPLPTIERVEPANGPYSLLVKWATGRRVGEEVIDLAPHLFAFKVYRPLRDDRDLFAKVTVSDDGTAVLWPGDVDLEVSADALEELAEDKMTSERFGQVLRELNLTFDSAAVQLGISRRLVAYYAKEREVPRYISLACEALKTRRK